VDASVFAHSADMTQVGKLRPRVDDKLFMNVFEECCKNPLIEMVGLDLKRISNSQEFD
jgi:hypothetical protein